jgi:hypothetical protein
MEGPMSSYRWMIFAVAAAMLGVGAWYFGRPIHPKPMPEEKRVASVTPAQVEAPRELPPKVIEVIDLTQAYEPVREPEPVVLGQVDPASFIEEQSAPAKIPYALDLDNPYFDLLIQIREAQTGSLLFGVPLVKPERIDVEPREVVVIQREEQERCTGVREDDFVGFIGPGSEGLAEKLNVMPRELHTPVKVDVMPREVSPNFSFLIDKFN